MEAHDMTVVCSCVYLLTQNTGHIDLPFLKSVFPQPSLLHIAPKHETPHPHTQFKHKPQTNTSDQRFFHVMGFPCCCEFLKLLPETIKIVTGNIIIIKH